MKTFIELYKEITEGAMKEGLENKLKKLKNDDYDKHQLECLVHPEKQPPVWQIKECGCRDGKCIAACLFDAIKKDEQGKITINRELCTACAACVEACESNSLVLSRDTVSAIEALKEENAHVYAMLAPAFSGQFGDGVTIGKLRTALKKIGFFGVVEVAAFADILTLKEALEFDKNIKEEGDYRLASCCCPVWIALVRRKFANTLEHLTHTVSPMIAAGRVIKSVFPGAKTVFIGPCTAKKAEAKEKDVADAIDVVITFEELQNIFEAAGINPAEEAEEKSEHSSSAGRIYAKAGGVSRAVEMTLKRVRNESETKIKTHVACGVQDCRALLERIESEGTEYNFFEGMGCKGGCIGGPKVLQPSDETQKSVESYAAEAKFSTPIDNPYVIDLLYRLGFETVEDFLENCDILNRSFE